MQDLNLRKDPNLQLDQMSRRIKNKYNNHNLQTNNKLKKVNQNLKVLKLDYVQKIMYESLQFLVKYQIVE